MRAALLQSVDASDSSTNDSIDIHKAILSQFEHLTKGVDGLRDDLSLKKSIDDTKAYLVTYLRRKAQRSSVHLKKTSTF